MILTDIAFFCELWTFSGMVSEVEAVLWSPPVGLDSGLWGEGGQQMVASVQGLAREPDGVGPISLAPVFGRPTDGDCDGREAATIDGPCYGRCDG